ncbi:hypothetical protein F4778DRAFT_469080 [Xylariomycetidae sp. FL2044]|nr:hypothetical protein F4778DRAFT_469080 [Xylariomycetidae sp. FL2044]
MDPLTAIGLAGNVITFIDFSHKFLSRTAEIYRAVDGQLKDRDALGNVLRNSIFLASNAPAPKGSVAVGIDSTSLDTNLKCFIGHDTILAHWMKKDASSPTDPFRNVALACSDIAKQILGKLEKSKGNGNRKIWPSLKLALQEFWNYSEVEAMLRNLDLYQRELELHMLVSLRENLELMSNRQRDQFDSLRTSMQETIRDLFKQNMLGAPNKATYSPPSKSSSDWSATARHQETRRAISKAINDALDNRGLTSLDINTLGRPTVLEEAAVDWSARLLKGEKELLDSLKYMVMLDREEDISDAERGTFDFVFDEPELGPDESPSWDSFQRWLCGTDLLYWLTGKAGSGKSTLMKHLFCHSKTKAALAQWADAQPLVVAGFFFWNSGSALQKTQSGLLRSLIFQILSRHRELIPVVLGDMARTEVAAECIWTASRLKKVFETIIEQQAVPLKICFFVDGLDEYSGDHGEIAGLMRQAALASNVKICASSRPLLVFERSFDGFPRLMLQNLTSGDIRTYVRQKFDEDESMRQLQKDEPELASRLSNEIMVKASGVFMWVKLVVRSLLEGLGSFDRGSDLERRLEELPEDLEELYWHMLRSVKPAFYFEQASKLLQIAHRAHKPLSLLQLAYADHEDPSFAQKAGFNCFTKEQTQSMCEFTEGRLKTRCLGLIEVATLSSTTDFTTRSVQFLHQSVAEFLEKADVREKMEKSLAGQRFSPYACLMSSGLLELKNIDTEPFPHRQPAVVMAHLWYQLAWPTIVHCASYAKWQETIHKSASVELLEELDRVAFRLSSLYVGAESRFDMSRAVHWSERRKVGVPLQPLQVDGSMISFALESGLYTEVRPSCGRGILSEPR